MRMYLRIRPGRGPGRFAAVRPASTAAAQAAAPGFAGEGQSSRLAAPRRPQHTERGQRGTEQGTGNPEGTRCSGVQELPLFVAWHMSSSTLATRSPANPVRWELANL